MNTLNYFDNEQYVG